MSLKVNVAANYAGQLYTALIGILLVPTYVRYMGVEAYGLVGFFTMLQGWFMLLDLGLTPTIGREMARLKGGAVDGLELRRLLRALEWIVAFVGIAGAVTLILGAGFVAEYWLKVRALDLIEVRNAIMLMAVTVALRWIASLYRAAIGGYELFVWLNGFSILVATLRFVIVIPLLIHVGATPVLFFGYQLGVALFEMLALVAKTYSFLPPSRGQTFGWSWSPVRAVLPFALSSAFASAVWVFVTQADKFILSGILPLPEYAYFTLAALAASGVTLLSTPMGGVIMPRLTRLSASGDEAGFRQTYRDATQVAGVLVVPVTLLLALFPKQILSVWTGSPDIAKSASVVLGLYAIGNGILTLAAFPYYLQVARGNLSLHVLGNALFMVLLVPSLIAATIRFGVVGAGYAWIAANLLPFLTWFPLVHRRYLGGLHSRWLVRDIGSILVLPMIVGVASIAVLDWPDDKWHMSGLLVLVYIALTTAAAAGSSTVRDWVRAKRATGAHAV